MTASELLTTAAKLRAALAAKPARSRHDLPREIVAYRRLIAEADRFAIVYRAGRNLFTAVLDLDTPELDLGPVRFGDANSAPSSAINRELDVRAIAENAAR